MWKFVAVTNKNLVEKIGKVVSNRVGSIIDACKDVGYENISKYKYFLTFFKDAPAVILAFAKPSANEVALALDKLNMRVHTPTPVDPIQQSMGAAIQNISLAAHAKGYGTTWMYAPVIAYREIGEIVNVSEPWVLSALLPIGRPAQQPNTRPREPIEEVFSIIK